MEVLDANQDRTYLSTLSHSAGRDLLRVCDLSVNFRADSGNESSVVKRLSFTIAPGEIVGWLGESGSGKTTMALALMQMLPFGARVVEGVIEFNGQNLCKLEGHRLREIRGSEISIVYQNSNVLNPVMRVGDQVTEVLRAHRNWTSARMREEAYSTLAALGFEDCGRIFRAYPHQLSGGQRRRIAIAQAVVCKPRLVIADEPTSWLDANTTAEILAFFAQMKDLCGTSFLLISHDPEVLTAADRVLVMYAGEIVESGITHEVIERPEHPYTVALLQCGTPTGLAPSHAHRRHRLISIPGHAPDPAEALTGCSFSARCRDRMEGCDSRQPGLVEISSSRWARCLKYGDGT